MDINTVTGGNIRRLRESTDMTQQQLANHLGTDKSAVSALERGVVALTGKRLEVLCEVFACTPDAFFKLNGHQDVVEEMLHEEIDRMSREDKAALYAHAVSLNTKAGK